MFRRPAWKAKDGEKERTKEKRREKGKERIRFEFCIARYTKCSLHNFKREPRFCIFNILIYCMCSHLLSSLNSFFFENNCLSLSNVLIDACGSHTNILSIKTDTNATMFEKQMSGLFVIKYLSLMLSS